MGQVPVGFELAELTAGRSQVKRASRVELGNDVSVEMSSKLNGLTTFAVKRTEALPSCVQSAVGEGVSIGSGPETPPRSLGE